MSVELLTAKLGEPLRHAFYHDLEGVDPQTLDSSHPVSPQKLAALGWIIRQVPQGQDYEEEARNLARELPQLSQKERDALFGSITDVLAYPRGSEIREGVIAGTHSSPSISEAELSSLARNSI